MQKTALVPIADGTEEMEAVTIIDVLRRAGCEVTVASVSNLQVTASRGVKLVADVSIDDCKDTVFDLITLPGGMPGAEHLRDCVVLTEMLKTQTDAGRLYGAICAAPVVVLQTHGLLPQNATCHPAFTEQLANKDKASQRVVVDSNCITSMGPGTATEFALELVRQLFDDETMQNVAGPMCVK